MDLQVIPPLYTWIRKNWLSFLLITSLLLGIYATFQFIAGYAKPLGEQIAEQRLTGRAELKRAVAAYTAFDTILQKELPRFNANRAGFMRFHDRTMDLSRMNFFYASIGSMIASPGISVDLPQLINVPILTFQVILEHLVRKQPELFFTRDLEESTLKELLTKRGTIATAYVPIYDLKDNIIGFLFVDWLRAEDVPTDHRAVIDALATDASRIGGYLSLQPDKGGLAGTPHSFWRTLVGSTPKEGPQ